MPRVFVWLMMAAAVACGSDGPSTPTPITPTAPSGPDAIVVTITARVVPNVAPSGLITGETVEHRNLHMTGELTVAGGSVTVDGSVTFIPSVGQEVVVDFLEGDFSPGVYNADQQIPYALPPGTDGGGEIRIDVTGTDANGDPVAESLTLDAPNDATILPPFHHPCVEDSGTMCIGPGRFFVDGTWTDTVGQMGDLVVAESQRFPDGGWFQIAGDPQGNTFDPNGFDVFIRVENNCAASGHHGVIVIGQTDVGFMLTVTDTQANQTRTYTSPLGTAAPAITDTQAFETCP